MKAAHIRTLRNCFVRTVFHRDCFTGGITEFSESRFNAGLVGSRFGALVRENTVEGDRELMSGIVARAAGRGELPPDVEPIALEVPMSMTFARVLLLDGGLTEDYRIDHVPDSAVVGTARIQAVEPTLTA